jgi:hypothetical protein
MSHAPYEPIPQAPPQWAQQPIQPSRAPSRLLPVLGVILGSLGLIAGVAAWFRAAPPTQGASAVYSEQQVNEAKAAVCGDYRKAVRSFQIAGNRTVDNPADKLAVAVNTRLAEVAAGNYMNNSIDSNAAAPEDLKNLIRQLARTYQDIALTQLAEGTQADVEPFGDSADKVILDINKICP